MTFNGLIFAEEELCVKRDGVMYSAWGDKIITDLKLCNVPQVLVF